MNKPVPEMEVLKTIARDLVSQYQDQQIEAAMTRVMRESEWLTLKAIIERIDDGRPGPEQAWAMCPKDEETSVVWTDEMAEAYGPTRQLLMHGDSVGARMAFREHYQALLISAKTAGRPVHWQVSFGFNRTDRVRALSEAVIHGWIDREYALSLLPEQENELMLALPEPKVETKFLPWKNRS